MHNVFTEKVSKIVLSVNGDERLQVIDRMILYPYGTGPGKVCKAESSVHETTPENEKLNIMINFDDVTGKNTEEQSPRWSQVLDHPYKILIVGGSESR